jgi:ParB family chromosome partitioning protein
MEELKVVDTIVEIPMERLVINEAANCRQKIDPLDVITLWQTIERDGLIQPITVRRVDAKFQLVCGFRRWKAHLVGGAKAIKARIITCSDEDVKVLNIIENIERKQLNVLEEAQAVQKFMFQGWTQQRIAERFRVTRVWVIQRQMLLKMPECIQQDVAAGLIKMAHIQQLSKLKDTNAQIEAVKTIKDAALRGEKITGTVLRPPAPSDAVLKRARTRAEIQGILPTVMAKVGPCFGTRCLSWASGEISTDDFWKDVLKEMAQNG